MTSCQVSEKPKIGPDISQTTMTLAAMTSADGEPALRVIESAVWLNYSFMPRYPPLWTTCAAVQRAWAVASVTSVASDVSS